MARIANTIQIDSIHATMENISLKSISSTCVQALTTKQALCLTTKPSTLYLIFKIHLQLIGLPLGGRGIST
jgi:hypothetical protein